MEPLGGGMRQYYRNAGYLHSRIRHVWETWRSHLPGTTQDYSDHNGFTHEILYTCPNQLEVYVRKLLLSHIHAWDFVHTPKSVGSVLEGVIHPPHFHSRASGI